MNNYLKINFQEYVDYLFSDEAKPEYPNIPRYKTKSYTGYHTPPSSHDKTIIEEERALNYEIKRPKIDDAVKLNDQLDEIYSILSDNENRAVLDRIKKNLIDTNYKKIGLLWGLIEAGNEIIFKLQKGQSNMRTATNMLYELLLRAGLDERNLNTLQTSKIISKYIGYSEDNIRHVIGKIRYQKSEEKANDKIYQVILKDLDTLNL